MKHILSVVFLISNLYFSQSYKTPFEQGNGNQTTTFHAMRAYYQQLAKDFQNRYYITTLTNLANL
ncbi:hypothetical protein ACVFVN_01890 [Soonwooa purpurea]